MHLKLGYIRLLAVHVRDIVHQIPMLYFISFTQWKKC